jgi:hypothetical protein
MLATPLCCLPPLSCPIYCFNCIPGEFLKSFKPFLLPITHYSGPFWSISDKIQNKCKIYSYSIIKNQENSSNIRIGSPDDTTHTGMFIFCSYLILKTENSVLCVILQWIFVFHSEGLLYITWCFYCVLGGFSIFMHPFCFQKLIIFGLFWNIFDKMRKNAKNIPTTSQKIKRIHQVFGLDPLTALYSLVCSDFANS